MKNRNNRYRKRTTFDKDMKGLQIFAEDASESEEGTEEEKKESQNESQKEQQDEQKESKTKEKKYSDEDVDRIINKKFAAWEKKQREENSEAEKLANMNAQEKAEYKAEQFEKKLKELERKDMLAQMSKEARKMLAEEEINIPDELLAHIVSEDAEDTKATVTVFAKLFKDTVQEAVKGKLKGTAPKTGTGKSTMTKEQIMAIKNPSERQRLIAENISLFEQ